MILAHDLGTTGNKATLVADDGSMVAAVTSRYATDFGSGGKAEQDPHAWWAAVIDATAQLLERTGVAPADIAAVSFSGQMMGVVPIDAAGDPVRPAIIWADTRSQPQTEAIVERMGMERGYAITGHRLNPTYSLTKAMWIRDNEPEAFARMATVLQAKDYIAYRLTGVLATDPSDASSTNAYDQQAGTWSAEIIDAAGLDAGLFPQIVDSTAVVGHIHADAARDTGLVAGTPVVMGGGDGPLAALGAGIIDAASGAYAYLGSSSWVSVSADAPLHDPQMRTMTFNHVIPGQFVPTATMQAGGASLQWIAELLVPDNGDRYEQLLDGIGQVAAADDGLYFLPHLLGERSPYWNPRARAAFVGLLRHHDRPHMMRAVLEGIAFNLHTGLIAFAENGSPTQSIDAIGGAANSSALLQIFADVWGVPVAARNLVDEANALGAAIVGGVGVGIFDSFDIARTLSSRHEPLMADSARHDRYGPQYQTFLDAYQRLEGWFEQLP